MGIMLVYDITNDKSFENIKNWIRNIEEVSDLHSNFKAYKKCVNVFVRLIKNHFLIGSLVDLASDFSSNLGQHRLTHSYEHTFT